MDPANDIYLSAVSAWEICQALIGNFTLVTPDENIARYPVRTLW